MSQNRKPPAYQEYPASMLANLNFRLLTFAQRGLLYTMRMECWVNSHLPADPPTLALLLGQSEHEIAAALNTLLPFFSVHDGWITCPELDDYKAHLEEKRLKQRAGGKVGSLITNQAKAIARSSMPSSNSPSSSSRKSSSKSSGNSTTKSLGASTTKPPGDSFDDVPF